MKKRRGYNKKILVINPFGIGDVLFSTPLIRALRDTHPDSYIGYFCNRRAREVLGSNPNIDRIFVYEKDDYRACWKESRLKCAMKILGLLNDIAKERFDTAIDLSMGYQYSFFLKWIGIRQRLGFNYRDRGRFLTDKIDIEGFDTKHVIEYYLDVLNLMGIDSGKRLSSPEIHVKKEDIEWADGFLRANGVSGDDALVGIIPGCGASWGADADYRRWSREGFAKVCDVIINKYGAKVLLLGSPQETVICEDVAKLMKQRPVFACGKTSIGNFLALIKRCRVVVTNDGGPLHMAVGVGVKTVSIFGPVDEKIYGPYPPGPDHLVVSRKDLACRPCYRKFKYTMCPKRTCLTSISPEEVLGAVDQLLSKEMTKFA